MPPVSQLDAEGSAYSCPPKDREGRQPVRTFGLVAWIVTLALVGYSIWRLSIDLSPAPTLAEVDRLVAGRPKDAERLLRGILQRDPENGDARMRFARLLARLGDTRASADALHEIPFWWPNKREAQFLEGQSYIDCQRARDAESAWLGCVRDDPLHPVDPGMVKNAAQALVALYMLEGRVDEAHAALWEAYAQASPAEQPAILGTHLRVELERIEPREAAATLERYVAADPADLNAQRSLALAHQLLGDHESADRLIEECLRKAPADAAVWRTWLDILEDRNDAAGLAAAIARIPKALYGADPKIDRARAAVLESEGRLKEAAAILDQTLTANDHDDEAHFRRARIAQRLGDAASAEEHRERHRQLRAALSDLSRALTEFAELSRAVLPDTEQKSALIDRLARLSETLGWKRLAEAWRKHR